MEYNTKTGRWTIETGEMLLIDCVGHLAVVSFSFWNRTWALTTRDKILIGGGHDEEGRKGDQTSDQGISRADSGNAIVEPDYPGKCAYPAGRYGFDQPHTANARAVCSICCPYNITCKTRHRTFDDLDNPRSASTPPEVWNPAPAQDGRDTKRISTS